MGGGGANGWSAKDVNNLLSYILKQYQAKDLTSNQLITKMLPIFIQLRTPI